MSAWLAVAEVALVLAAAVGAVYLKRAGERAWTRHLIRRRLERFNKAMVKVTITLCDDFTPAMKRAADAFAKFGEALDRKQP
jgi:hypothetical protein